MKKLIVVLLTAFMLVLLAVPVMAASDEANSAAYALYELGLFKGTGTDWKGNPQFKLDNISTRHEAVTMLIRLLGKEEEALAGTWETPFTDVDSWAEPYVGYAYANGLTVGTGPTTFGSYDKVTATQYLTFVLRSLGYENGVDFQWDKAWLLSDKLGMTDGQYGADKRFTRGDMAIISERALQTPRKGEQKTEEPSAFAGLAYAVNADGTSCTIVGIGNCTDKNVEIPEEIDGYNVTAIGEKAFADCTDITSIIIPNTVTSIGQRAFYGCTGITEMTIPASVTDIGLQIFYKASNLHTVYYNSSYASENNSFLSTVSSVKKVVFGGSVVPAHILRTRVSYSPIQEIEILDGVTQIGDYAFAACSKIESIVIPNSVTIIGKEAFSECGGLKTVTLPDRMTSIGEYAFYFCRKLERIKLPYGITEISNDLFSVCDNLKSITIPDSITKIDSFAFNCCSKLENITIPDGVTSIGGQVFWGCSGLQSITIPDSVIEIGSSTFAGCTDLASISLSRNLTTIEHGLFTYCTALKSIIIPDGVTYIGDEAFMDCISLESIVISDSVTRIDDEAFMNCSSLKSITIPDSVTVIGERAFCDCTALIGIEMSDNVTVIEGDAFRRCRSLESLVIPGTITDIDTYVFAGCDNLKSIYYNGTIAQWNSVSDDAYWNPTYGCDATLYCTDGNILL